MTSETDVQEVYIHKHVWEDSYLFWGCEYVPVIRCARCKVIHHVDWQLQQTTRGQDVTTST